MNRWREYRRNFWRNASHSAGLAAVGFTLSGLISGTGVLVALGACCAVLTLTFGRRARS